MGSSDAGEGDTGGYFVTFKFRRRQEARTKRQVRSVLRKRAETGSLYWDVVSPYFLFTEAIRGGVTEAPRRKKRLAAEKPQRLKMATSVRWK